MKPTLQVIPNEDNTGYIVIMEKNISNVIDIYNRQKEITKFKSTELKVFTDTIDMVIREILKQFGIIPFNSSKSALESAFDTLNRKYGKTIEIVDSYAFVDETIIDKQDLITIILEKGVLSCANEVRVADY